MDKIASFTVNHLTLKKGLYVSRIDSYNENCVTTFDLRMTSPNIEPVIDINALHTIEHLGATYLRNCKDKNRIVYFGPMGCRTGFYLIMFGKLESKDVLPLIIDMCKFIVSYEGEIPGASPKECGNYLSQDLPMAKYYINKYLTSLLNNPNLEYSRTKAK